MLEPETNTAETPIVFFQRLCNAMLDGSSNTLTKKNLEDFRVILHIIMHECSKGNIESGKVWIVDYCRTPRHATAIMNYILSLSTSRKGQQERLHMVYLVSDILFHTLSVFFSRENELMTTKTISIDSSRRRVDWLKDAILPFLSPLLDRAYNCADSTEYQPKVMKVITLWGDNNIFDHGIIEQMRNALSGQGMHRSFEPVQQQYHHQQPMYQQQSYPQQNMPYVQPMQPIVYNQSPSHIQPPQQRSPFSFQPMIAPSTPPQRPYFELPAGLMVAAKTEDYTPINPSAIKLIHPRPPISKEILDAVDEYYKEINSTNEAESIFEEKSNSNIDAQGWEKGYLDVHYTLIVERRKENESTYREKRETVHHERRASPRRRRGYSRSPSPVRHSRRSSRSPRRKYSRSPSPRRRNSPTRGRSPPPTHARRDSPPFRYNRQRRYSRSRSPPPNRSSRSDFATHVAPENRYLGLGNSVTNEFDSFRMNKSQAYSKREPHQPLTCYKCNKVGHLARECQSL